MLKKYKQTAIVLAAARLKNMAGGTGQESLAAKPQCATTLDCPTPCDGGRLDGNICIANRCVYVNCA